MLFALMIYARVRTLSLLLAFSTASWILRAQPAAPPAAGIWLGTLHADTAAYRDQLHLQLAGGAWTCAVDNIDLKVFNVPCTNVQVSGNTVSLDVPGVHGRYAATLSPDGNTLTGTYSTQGRSAPLVMERQSTAIEPPPDRDFKRELAVKLDSRFRLTKFTADHNDILQAGSVLVLRKEPLVMFTTAEILPPTNVYKAGKLTLGFGTSLEAIKTGDERIQQRTFVQSEKFWLASVSLAEDGLYLVLISDPYNDVRYYTKLKFPFNRKSMPTSDELMNTVAEVVAAQPDTAPGSAPDTAVAAGQPQEPPAAPAPPAPGLAPIPAPPPPPDAPPAQPKTIAIGQSKDVVVAIFGQPQKVVKLGAREIDIYPDLKVTFVNGKVTDVQ